MVESVDIKRVLEEPFQYARDWKLAHRKRVIGTFLSDAPEELIDASDSLPFALLDGKRDPGPGIPVPSFACSLIINTLQQGLSKELEFLDGIVIPYLCDSSRSLFHMWKRNFPTQFSDFLRLPKKLQGHGVKDFLIHELKRFVETLQKFYGVSIMEERISKSIHTYNENRRYLRRIKALRHGNPNLMSNFEFFSLIKSSMLMLKKKHNQILKGVIPEKESSLVSSYSIKSKKVFLSGKIGVPFEIFQWLDGMGISITDDDLAVGSRYFSYEVEENKDPFQALAESYFKRIPSALVEGQDRLSYIVEQVKEGGLKGVIFLHLKFCEPLIFDYPDLKKGLDREGIPNLFIETELHTSASSQIKTRLQAFSEMLE